jgi:hypothetical protein
MPQGPHTTRRVLIIGLSFSWFFPFSGTLTLSLETQEGCLNWLESPTLPPYTCTDSHRRTAKTNHHAQDTGGRAVRAFTLARKR